jgi:hypothetical protein
MLRADDALYIADGPRGGIGISVLRKGELVAAAGRVSCVPLGARVKVGAPGDLISQAQAIFRTRDATYDMWECPLEVTVDTTTRLLHRGRIDFGLYEVFVVHGFVLWKECVAISRLGVCPDCAATLTAPLLGKPEALHTVSFRDGRLERMRRAQEAIELAREFPADRAFEAAIESATRALAYDDNSDEARALMRLAVDATDSTEA